MVRFGFSLGDSSEDEEHQSRRSSRRTSRDVSLHGEKGSQDNGKQKQTPQPPSRRMVLRFGKRQAADSSSDTSTSSDESDDSDIDSEEEAFPVSAKHHASTGLASNATVGLAKFAALDVWDVQNMKGRKEAWDSWMVRASAAHALAEEQDALFLSQAQKRWRMQHAQEMTEVTDMLRSLEVGRQEEERKLYSNFEQRNADLWADIEAAIKAKEADEAELQAARHRQIAAEKAAKEAKAKAQQEADEKAKAQAEAEAKAKQDAQKAKEAKDKAAEAAQARNTPGPPSSTRTDASAQDLCAKNWQKWASTMEQIKTGVLPAVTANAAWKKACRDAKRAMTPKVGQLTNSSKHIIEIAQAVSQTLDNLRSVGFEVYIWGLNHLSKATIKQAETEVTARLQGAFPLARFILHLILTHNHADLADVFTARLVKKCFWLTGFHPPQAAFPSAQAHQKALGYDMPSDGSASTESLMSYAQRMNGIISLYGALIAVSPPLPAVPQQFRPSQAWTLLAALCRPPICASEPVPQLLEAVLYMTGKRMTLIYGQQFAKFWKCLAVEGLQANKAHFKVDVGWVKANCAKLMLMLEDWATKGINEPEGLQPDP